MQKQYIIYGAVGVVLLIVILAVIMGKNKNNTNLSLENVVESYFYRYGGDLSWIKGKLETYRFKALNSMLVCKSAEEADFRIDILEGKNSRTMNVYGTEFSYDKSPRLEPIIVGLSLTDEQYEFFLSNARLKSTYVISSEDEEFDDDLDDFVE